MSTAPTPPAPRRHSLLSGAQAWLLATIDDINRPAWLYIPVLGFLPMTFGSTATFFWFGACIYVGVVFLARRISWVWPRTTAFGCLVALGYFAVTLISPLAFANPIAGWMDVGTALHFLTVVMLVGALVQAPKVDVFDLFLNGLRAACIVALGHALVQVYIFGHPRATAGMANAIPFGDTAMMSAGLAMVGFQRLSRPMRVFAVAAFAAGVAATLLSQTRGALLALPLVVLVVTVHLWPMIRRRLWLAGLVASALVAVLAIFAVEMKVPQRIDQVRVALEAEDITRHPDVTTTHRIILWSYGLDVFLDNPVAGVGSQNAVEEARRRAAADGLSVPVYRHLHNEFISTAVGRGVIGLIALVAMLAAPILIAMESARDDRRSDRVAFAILLSGCYALFGLTNLLFSHDQTNTVFLSCYLILLAAAHQSRVGLTQFQRPFLGVPPRA